MTAPFTPQVGMLFIFRFPCDPNPDAIIVDDETASGGRKIVVRGTNTNGDIGQYNPPIPPPSIYDDYVSQ